MIKKGHGGSRKNNTSYVEWDFIEFVCSFCVVVPFFLDALSESAGISFQRQSWCLETTPNPLRIYGRVLGNRKGGNLLQPLLVVQKKVQIFHDVFINCK